MKSCLLSAVRAFACVFTFTGITSVQAAPVSGQGTWETTLQARDFDGNSATIEGWYDTVVDITWLENTTAGAGSAFDDGFSTTDGRMTWSNAMGWTASLEINGITGWRLANINPIDGVTFNNANTRNGTSDIGNNISAPGTAFAGSTASELAHMFHNTLGNLSPCDPLTSTASTCAPQSGSGLTNTGPFDNLQFVQRPSTNYWSAAETSGGGARGFNFDFDSQFLGIQTSDFGAWAVHDGDVGAAIVPVAVEYTFTKIIDSSDAIPNGIGNFTGFGSPSLDGRDMVFPAQGPGGYEGVYTYIGENLKLVADTNTSMPGGITNFGSLGGPEIDAGNVVFGGGSFTNQIRSQGIYTNLGGSLRAVADLNTPIPSGTGTFTLLKDEDFSISNGVVAFTGFGGPAGQRFNQSGVYTDINGALGVIADQNTPAPDGSGNFDGAGFAGMNGSDVAFTGSNAVVSGTYLNSRGTISTVIDSNTLIPGSTETFGRASASDMDVAEGTIIFVDGAGMYSNVGGNLHLIAEIGDTTPDGIGSFTFFDNLAVDGDDLAFTAGDDIGDLNDVNIYSYFRGTLNEVISIGDTLDGKSVINLNTHAAGLDDSVIAFTVRFDDGSSGIYLAEVASSPEEVPGDLDGDGVIDETDFTVFLTMFGLCEGASGFNAQADYDEDGCITFVDYQTWYGFFINQ